MPKQTIKVKLEVKTTWKLKNQLERHTRDEHKAHHDYLLASFCLITAVKQQFLYKAKSSWEIWHLQF